MFTGIIEELGKVHDLRFKENLCVLKIDTRNVCKGARLGDSVAINGVCLTVTRIAGRTLSFDMMKETIRRTNLKDLKAKQKVNLERPLKLGDRLGGHFVLGHVDGVGVIKKIIKSHNYLEFQIASEKSLIRYMVPKGSICIDGVSLTVGWVKGTSFSVYLVPHTIRATNFKDKKASDLVNIEVDMIAKYVLDKSN